MYSMNITFTHTQNPLDKSLPLLGKGDKQLSGI